MWPGKLVGIGVATVCVLPFLAAAIAPSLLVGGPAEAGSADKRVPPTSILLAKGAVISAQGDSLTYGFDVSSQGMQPAINGSNFTRSTNPFPEALGRLLPECSVLNEGFPGDRSVDGLVRWQDAPRRDLTLLMFGSNDALNNGQASSGIVSVETFRIVISAIIERYEAAGGMVALLIPPPIGDPATDRRIDPYRDEVRAVAQSRGLMVVDTPEILATTKAVWTPDRVHLTSSSNQMIADALAQVLRCGDAPAPSQMVKP